MSFKSICNGRFCTDFPCISSTNVDEWNVKVRLNLSTSHSTFLQANPRSRHKSSAKLEQHARRQYQETSSKWPIFTERKTQASIMAHFYKQASLTNPTDACAAACTVGKSTWASNADSGNAWKEYRRVLALQALTPGREYVGRDISVSNENG